MPSNLVRTFELANFTLSVLCTNICGDCGGSQQTLNTVVGEDIIVCERCAERREETLCERCESYYSWSTRGLYGLCERCEPNDSAYHIFRTPSRGPYFFIRSVPNTSRQEIISEINSYSYKPPALFFGSGPLFMGVELEVLASSETAEKLHDLSGNRAYLKHDSSIRGAGFEIVTHPMSLDEQLAYWQSAIHHVGNELSHNSSCGMHVHVSRRPLTQLQIGKVLVFLNNPANDGWIDLIAGRSGNQYCQRKKKSIDDVGKADSRYEALNLLNNETIEFRLFASSNKEEEIMYRIEFCHAVVMWAEEAALDQLEWSFFMEWLHENTEDAYPYLKEELSCWRAGGVPAPAVKTIDREAAVAAFMSESAQICNSVYSNREVTATLTVGDNEEEDIDNIPF